MMYKVFILLVLFSTGFAVPVEPQGGPANLAIGAPTANVTAPASSTAAPTTQKAEPVTEQKTEAPVIESTTAEPDSAFGMEFLVLPAAVLFNYYVL